MSFEHPNRNNESMIDVERDIMSRPSERNTTNLDLRRMKMILDIMGHPEQSFRVIHITGTNGKTTTAFLVRSLLEAAGRPCGLLGTVKSVIGGEEHAVVRTTPEAIDLQRTFAAMLAAPEPI